MENFSEAGIRIPKQKGILILRDAAGRYVRWIRCYFAIFLSSSIKNILQGMKF
jgi:hypothetical protein